MRYLCVLLSLLWSVQLAGQTPTTARTVSIGSFDHIRVERPFDVHVTMGLPCAKIAGTRADSDVVVRVDGATLSVRKNTSSWGERPRGVSSSPSIVTLSTPQLISASVAAGGQLKIAKMRGMRIDVTGSGSSSLALVAADTDQLNATVIGPGSMMLAGKAGRARLVTNGAGMIDASGLDVKDLTVHLDDVGETKASALYTAQVTNSGLGTVAITGDAKCLVDVAARGPVTCWKPRAVAAP